MDPKAFRTIHQIVRAARKNLDQTYWDYLIGGSDTETTMKRNRLSLDSIALRPRILNDVSQIDTSGMLLGEKLTIPVLLAPIGSLQMFEPGGGASAAKAAEEFGVINMLSSVCTPELEEVARSSASRKIYQLYVRGDADWTDEIVKRAIDSGYMGFCLTVDTALVSRRERDIAKNVQPTSQSQQGGYEWQARLNWKDVERIRRKFNIPLILKGISRVEDAIKAVDMGIDVIYVSNHGGRQLDQGEGSIDVLPGIVNAVNGRAEIVVDGGFYRGTDIVKAMALGANAVGLGRLEAWSLAAGGVPALVRCLKLLQNEIHLTLGLLGVTRFAELDSSFVTKASPVVSPDVTSAFPLLSLEDTFY